jgi:carbonic anhydrase
MSVLQFAVETLKVKHIIVCGHYGCGGVQAVLEGSPHGLVEHWLAPIRDLYRQHHDELARLPSLEAREDRVCELNVTAQVNSLWHAPVVRSAWERGQELSIHGWIYRLTEGLLRSLHCSRSGPADGGGA